MRRCLTGLRWPLLVSLGVVLPLAWVLVTGHTLVWRDTAQLNAALRPMIVESIRAWRLPAWNPWEGSGQPLFAQLLHGVLHPVSIAVAWLTPSTDALIVALVLFAGLGTWIAARVLGVSRAASAGAAFAFAMSGYMLSMSNNTSYLISTASGPWVVAGLVVASQRPRGWLAGAVAAAVLAFSGDPGSFAAFTLVGGVLAWAAHRWRGLTRAGLASILGVALASVQLLPSWIYMADTARGSGFLNPGDLHRWALAPWRILEIIAPGFFVGVPRSYIAPVFAALDGATPDRFPFSPSIFIGAPVILLAVIGARRSITARCLAGLSVLFLWFSLGHRAGSQDLLSWIPVWGVLRYWEKMVGPLTLCLSLAAGFGIDALGTGPWRAPARATGACAGMALIGVAVLAIPTVSGVFAADPVPANLARMHLQVGLAHAAAGLALLGGALMLGKRWPPYLASAVTMAVFLQSAAASPFSLHLGQPSALAVRPPALTAEPPGPRIVAPLGCDFLEGSGGFDAIDLLNICERRSGRPSTNAEAHMDSIATYSSLTPGRWDMILASGRLFWPLTRRFATSHVVAHPPVSDEEVAALRASISGATGYRELDGGRLLVWEIPHRPWAFFASSARVAPSRDVAGAMLGEEMEAGRQTVIVETGSSPPAVSSGRVLSVHRGTEEVVIDAESDGEALLVVNDAWAPGWQASIDGVEVELMPADILVRAVRWPAERHRIVMRYEVPGLVAGGIVSCVAVAFAITLLIWQRGKS